MTYFKSKSFKPRKRRIFKRDILMITLVMIFLTTFFLFSILSKKISPVLLNYASSKAKNIATLMITQAVNKEVLSKMETDNLFNVSKDENNGIKSIDLNPVTTNTLLNEITNHVQDYIQKLEEGDIDNLGVSDSIFSNLDKSKLKEGIIYEIPGGLIFKNPLLANLGPKIPVRIDLIGEVISDLKTSITNYGINNALVKVTVYVEVTMKVLLPFASEEMKAETNIPITMRLIQGTVPEFYYGNK